MVSSPLECFLLAPLYLVCLSASWQGPDLTAGGVKNKNNTFRMWLKKEKDEGTSVYSVAMKSERNELESYFIFLPE